MKKNASPKIIDCDRLEDGLLVTFDDEKSVRYSSSQLYATATGVDAIEVKEKDQFPPGQHSPRATKKKAASTTGRRPTLK